MSRYRNGDYRHFNTCVGVLVVLPTARHVADLPLGVLAVRKEVSQCSTQLSFLLFVILDIFYTYHIFSDVTGRTDNYENLHREAR